MKQNKEKMDDHDEMELCGRSRRDEGGIKRLGGERKERVCGEERSHAEMCTVQRQVSLVRRWARVFDER